VSEARKRSSDGPRRLAGASFYVALAALLALAVAGPGYRVGWLPLAAGLLTAVGGMLAFALAFVLGAAALAWRRVRGGRPRLRTVVTVLVSAAVTIDAGWWLSRALTTPPIHDVTTDTADPPAFVAAIPLRRAAGAANPPDYVREQRTPGGGSIDVPDAQRAAYPDIVPLRLSLPPSRAFAVAEQAVRDMGWHVDAVDVAAGRVEATDSTAYFGFQDDIVVRVRAAAAGSIIDVRSESRVGLGDAGTNAARVRDYLDHVRELAPDAVTPPRS
jgi:uncharacterized protein (DUF1499 family)